MVGMDIIVTPSREVEQADLDAIFNFGKEEGLVIKSQGYYIREQAGVLDPLVLFTFEMFKLWLAAKTFDATWDAVKRALKKTRKMKTKKGSPPNIMLKIEDTGLDIIAHPAKETEEEFLDSLDSLPTYITNQKKFSGHIFFDTKNKRWVTIEERWAEQQKKD